MPQPTRAVRDIDHPAETGGRVVSGVARVRGAARLRTVPDLGRFSGVASVWGGWRPLGDRADHRPGACGQLEWAVANPEAAPESIVKPGAAVVVERLAERTRRGDAGGKR
jgi:hypothetical protein